MSPAAVLDPNYVVARPIRREADPEHTLRVGLPLAEGGWGFAASAPLLDARSFDLRAAGFAGGRTSIVGEASLWLPLKPEARPRLQAWSSQASAAGELLGIFLKGRLVAAPRVRDVTGAGIFLPVASKSEGDRVLREMRGGGAAS